MQVFCQQSSVFKKKISSSQTQKHCVILQCAKCICVAHLKLASSSTFEVQICSVVCHLADHDSPTRSAMTKLTFEFTLSGSTCKHPLCTFKGFRP